VQGALDATFAWDGTRFYGDHDLGPAVVVPEALRGAASVAAGDGHARWRFLRDPLGINKLFWGYDSSGAVRCAAKPYTLVNAGIPLEHLFSLPPGCVIDLDLDTGDNACRTIVPRAWRSPTGTDSNVERVGSAIRCKLDRYLAALADAHADAHVFVCLSGGLDSSGIAAIAREHFPAITAVSFDLARRHGRASEDRQTAQRLCRDLRLPLLTVTASHDDIFQHLDTVLIDGIDWRDFNVHAGLVNAVLASAIESAVPAADRLRPRLVLTGDLANEFLADYHPEHYDGKVYYALPRLKGGALRTALVRGLATSHREVGVFASWGLSAVQPYAVAVDDYLALPPELFEREDRKQRLCRAIFGGLLPEYIYARKKTRAQLGDREACGGVLAAAVDRGIDRALLRERFAALHGVSETRQLDGFLRGGYYRTAMPFVDREV
jgi:asparagine synthetase B (glutamine-hydrolysing)